MKDQHFIACVLQRLTRTAEEVRPVVIVTTLVGLYLVVSGGWVLVPLGVLERCVQTIPCIEAALQGNENARSDATTQLPPARAEALLASLAALRRTLVEEVPQRPP